MKDLTFKQISEKVSLAKELGSDNRERAANDLYFYWISHWSDDWRNAVPLKYMGQFDILRTAGRKIIGDLNANPIEATFAPKDGTDEKLGEFLEQMYRTDNLSNSARFAVDNAMNECVPCGIGGWRLVTQYETDRIGDTKQIIVREPIFEFNNTVLFDPQAKLIDKSDASWACVLTGYTEEAFEQLKEDLADDEETKTYSSDEEASSFESPLTSLMGLWTGEKNIVYVGEFYSRHKKKVTINFYRDLFGQITAYYKDEVDEIGEENLISAGYRKVDNKTVSRWCVTKYIVSGCGVLAKQEIAGTEIPIVPLYGEFARVNGLEHYEGITRGAKDPQMLRNLQMSYLADIVSTSPRPKPIFTQDQIQGYEFMYAENGADNNYPYYLVNRYDSNGVELPAGAMSVMPEQPIPQALIASIELTREAIGDAATSGAPNSIAETNLSGNAVSQIKAMFDEQSVVYQQHKEYAIRRDAEIYAGMVVDVYDIPRNVVLTLPNGGRKDGMVMQSVLNIETGEHEVLNDLRSAKFDVFVEIGTPYESQKQQNRQEIVQLMASVPPEDPMYKVLLLKYLGLGGGSDMDDIRAYSHKQLVLQGITEPETDEEKQWLAEAQQAAQESQTQDPNMLIGQAEMLKAQTQQEQNQIDWAKVENDRYALQIKAAESQVNIDFKTVQTTSAQIDNMHKLRNPPVPNHMQI
jgi:hypothetical protein